jgi:hypothetical protein
MNHKRIEVGRYCIKVGSNTYQKEHINIDSMMEYYILKAMAQ